MIVQNERYEEWNNTLRLLRKLFKHYLDYVLRYHHQQWPNWKIPTARNSTAARGNFLETLNMSLNCEWGGGRDPLAAPASITSCHKYRLFCHDKSMLVTTNILSRETNFVSRQMFCFNIILS